MRDIIIDLGIIINIIIDFKRSKNSSGQPLPQRRGIRKPQESYYAKDATSASISWREKASVITVTWFMKPLTALWLNRMAQLNFSSMQMGNHSLCLNVKRITNGQLTLRPRSKLRFLVFYMICYIELKSGVATVRSSKGHRDVRHFAKTKNRNS